MVRVELLSIYSTIGNAVLDRQSAEGRGSRVINRLADEPRAAQFPEMRRLGRSNAQCVSSLRPVL